MRTSTLTLASLFAIGLLAAGVLFTPSFASDRPSARAGEQPWLTIPQLADKLEAAGYRDIEKIEREHGGYEVRAINPSGQRVKLRLNPWTGEVDAQPSRARLQNQGDATECSKRRCRDDQPISR